MNNTRTLSAPATTDLTKQIELTAQAIASETREHISTLTLLAQTIEVHSIGLDYNVEAQVTATGIEIRYPNIQGLSELAVMVDLAQALEVMQDQYLND